jgi:hypothetical protein
MSTTATRIQASRLLDNLADALDVPDGKYAEAESRYKAVCEWLGADGSDLADYHPDMYPQGSFALGTAIRPLGEDHYDVDAVCLLKETTANITQRELKRKVGDRLKAHDTYKRMLKPPEGGRRCWTVEYADASRFHLDILPAIPDPAWQFVGVGVPADWAKHAIQITDQTTWDRTPTWPRSNPRGYAEWFKSRMRVRLEEGRRAVAMAKAASVADIPDYEVRTPLQRLVQILKRHRDIRYAGNEHRPISIIITTLAAHAYRNEGDLSDAIAAAIPQMRTLVERRNGVYWVLNPVNPAENFADKWAAEPEKASVFFEWLDAVERDHQALITATTDRAREQRLAEAFGERDATEAMKRMNAPSSTLRAVPSVSRSAPSRFDVPHRERPRWNLAHDLRRIPIRATFKRDGVTTAFTSNSAPVRKGSSLMFHADATDIGGPFDVYWQVVNTGAEAAAVPGGLRGQIKRSDSAGRGGLTQKEETAYTGSHWVECFIVQNDRCIARSGEFVVNIE